MKIEFWAQTDVGLKRELNEDSIYASREQGLFIVADGMGGHQGGEVASKMAVDTVENMVAAQLAADHRFDTATFISSCYQQAGRLIYEKSHVDSPELMGMGTTMVMAFFRGSDVYLGNVGDSRAYLFRDSNLWQMTEDHSLVNEKVRAGVLTEAESELMIGKNVITRSVGFEKSVSPDVFVRQVQSGDTYMLCSDGLSGLVEDPDMASILINEGVSRCVPALIQQAKDNGGDDNISVIVIRAT